MASSEVYRTTDAERDRVVELLATLRGAIARGQARLVDALARDDGLLPDVLGVQERVLTDLDYAIDAVRLFPDVADPGGPSVTRHSEDREVRAALREVILRFDYVREHVDREAGVRGWPYVREAIDRGRRALQAAAVADQGIRPIREATATELDSLAEQEHEERVARAGDGPLSTDGGD